MKPIQSAPKLTEQVYHAILDEICDGALPPGAHLVQEQLAERLGVSRQPVQQAMTLLKAGGIVVEVGAGRRGLCVAALDLTAMRHHYDIRSVLDGLAARGAARRAQNDPTVAADIETRGRTILSLGESALAGGAVAKQIQHDEAFHVLLYDVSGNPLLARTAEMHWQFLRRAMGDVLRHAESPRDIWRQHARILDAIVAGDAELAERRALDHIRLAADLLALHMTTASDREEQTPAAIDNSGQDASPTPIEHES